MQLPLPSTRNQILAIVSIIFLQLFVFLPAGLSQQREHAVYFEGTDYELYVYRIFGKEPGKTLLLIGGIQGDEPGGFHSADLYADYMLTKGNLIVVPRANFKSILMNRRQINEDMNRKFAEDQELNYESRVVEILKQLISESDMLLNLHDGSGYYSPSWISQDRNPMCYGQSIIADSEVYTDTKTGKKIDLGEMARNIAAKVNESITDPADHMRFNNHNTRSELSEHKEQRKSATYYALYTCGIPAFGIETSKNLPLELKIRYHNLAINAFMDYLGIQPETPGIRLDDPELKYLIVSVNDALPIAISANQTLHIRKGDAIMISHIESNYERGLSVDVLNVGGINDLRKRFTIDSPTKIVVRKDFYACGEVSITTDIGLEGGAPSIMVSSPPGVKYFIVRINGQEFHFSNNDRVRLTQGDQFQIVDVITDLKDNSGISVNFKGFVGDKSNNTGEDRGHVIDTARDLWPRYSTDGKGTQYHVVANRGSETIGGLDVELLMSSKQSPGKDTHVEEKN